MGLRYVWSIWEAIKVYHKVCDTSSKKKACTKEDNYAEQLKLSQFRHSVRVQTQTMNLSGIMFRFFLVNAGTVLKWVFNKISKYYSCKKTIIRVIVVCIHIDLKLSHQSITIIRKLCNNNGYKMKSSVVKYEAGYEDTISLRYKFFYWQDFNSIYVTQR